MHLPLINVYKDCIVQRRHKIALLAGVVPGIFRRGADSSDEGAKIWFSGYYKCQKSPKKSLSPSDGGLACSDEGAIAP